MYLHIYTYTHVHMYMYAYICIYICIYMYIYTYIHVHICMYIHIHMRVCVCVCVCVLINLILSQHGILMTFVKSQPTTTFTMHNAIKPTFEYFHHANTFSRRRLRNLLKISRILSSFRVRFLQNQLHSRFIQ